MDFASAFKMSVPVLISAAFGTDANMESIWTIEQDDGPRGGYTARRDAEGDIWIIGDDDEEDQDQDSRDKIEVLIALEDIAGVVKRRSLQDSMMFLGAPHSDVAPSYRRDVHLVSDAELFGAAFLESEADTFTCSFEDCDASAGFSPSTSLISLDSFLFSDTQTPATPATPFECDEVKPFANIPESCTHPSIMPSTWTLEEMTAALLSCSISGNLSDECYDAEALGEDPVDSESMLSIVAYLASLAVQGTLPASDDSSPASSSLISNSDSVIKYLNVLVHEGTGSTNSGHRRPDYLVSAPTAVDDDIATGICELRNLSASLTTKNDSLGVVSLDRGDLAFKKDNPGLGPSAPADCCAVRIPADKHVEEPGAPQHPKVYLHLFLG